MFIKGYCFEIENEQGTTIPVTLRLSFGDQIKLKNKYKGESTTTTLFDAADDIDRFNSIIDAALNYKGNTNVIKSAEELIDLMAANGMLGMAKRQELLTEIGYASGLFSKEEKDQINEHSRQMMASIFADDGVIPEETEAEKKKGKNA